MGGGEQKTRKIPRRNGCRVILSPVPFARRCRAWNGRRSVCGVVAYYTLAAVGFPGGGSKNRRLTIGRETAVILSMP